MRLLRNIFAVLVAAVILSAFKSDHVVAIFMIGD